jgi:hypothetical protein
MPKFQTIIPKIRIDQRKSVAEKSVRQSVKNQIIIKFKCLFVCSFASYYFDQNRPL